MMCENIEKKQINHHMLLAETIIKCNPDLPVAFKSKFEAMATNAHFATNVCVVICDAIDSGIILKLDNQTV